MEQGLGIFTENKNEGSSLLLFICDETDTDRPYYKHFNLLQSICSARKMIKDYDHTVWRYCYSDAHVYIQENDDILDKNEELICRLIDADEIRNQI